MRLTLKKDGDYMTKYTAPGQHINCKVCENEFVVTGYKQTICHDCKQRIQAEQSTRPYTDETPYLVWLWHSKGDSFSDIALALGRTVANVKEAYNKYVPREVS